jgi:Domain of unknown function (DUF6438)/Ankyrin repeats (3 copies)
MTHLRATICLSILVSITGAICAQQLPVITLRRTACFGTCPIYSLEIFENGRLHFNGEQFVSSIGSRQAQIAPTDVHALIEQFAKIRFFDLKDVYETRQNPDGTTEWITDLSTTYISLRVGNRSKTIKDYAFSPDNLRTLELEIERVTNTHRWIHGADDLKLDVLVRTDIYKRTKPGLNLFMQAAGMGDQVALVKERAKGTDINAQDETGWTALMLGAEQCREPIVRQLLDWNAKFNLKDDRGDDALMGAASAFCFEPSTRKAQAEIIKLLVAHGADPNSANHLGLTPLMLISAYGNEEATRVLIDAGAAVDSRDASGKTPLDHARDMLKKNKDSWWADELKQIVDLLEEDQNRLRPLPPGSD